MRTALQAGIALSCLLSMATANQQVLAETFSDNGSDDPSVTSMAFTADSRSILFATTSLGFRFAHGQVIYRQIGTSEVLLAHTLEKGTGSVIETQGSHAGLVYSDTGIAHIVECDWLDYQPATIRSLDGQN